MVKGSGVEFDPSSLFTMTTAKVTPSITDLMKVNNTEDGEGLKAPRSGNRKKVNGFALQTQH